MKIAFTKPGLSNDAMRSLAAYDACGSLNEKHHIASLAELSHRGIPKGMIICPREAFEGWCPDTKAGNRLYRGKKINSYYGGAQFSVGIVLN